LFLNISLKMYTWGCNFKEHFDWFKANWQPRPKFYVYLPEFFPEELFDNPSALCSLE
jgi:hypothetical protein